MEGCWMLFAATGAPEFYLLYRRRLQGDSCAAWLDTAGPAEV